jgi:hypothetical protein
MTLAFVAAGRAAADSRELFIGNSLTLTNDLPGLVRQMRSVSSAPMDYVSSTAATFGVGLDYHWADTSPLGAQTLLAGGGWDGVVLQDLSFNATDNPNKTSTYVHLWDDQIKAKSPDAATYLFAHWERQDRAGSQPVIDSLYSSLGAQLNATVVPAGDTWARLKTVRPDMALYVDPVHPSLRGSYAAAATFYASLFGQSPVGLLPPQGISSVDALAIQNTAWDVVSGRQTAVNRSWRSAGGNWNDPENWGPSGAPAAGDSIFITANDGASRVINYASDNGASTLLGSLNISAMSGSLTMQQSQSTLRVAGNMVLGNSSGGRANYELSGSGRIFAARDEQVINGSFAQHGGRHVVMQKLSIGGGLGLNAFYLLDGGLLSAGTVDVAQGGTLTQLGGTLNAGRISLSGGRIEGTLRNQGLFDYSSGVFHGKLINERSATLGFNSGVAAGAQLDVEAAGTGSSLVTASVDQDLRSLMVNFADAGNQGFDLASTPATGQYRTIRIYPPDAAALAVQKQNLSNSIDNAILHPGDGIFDSGLAGMANIRIGLASRLDANQRPYLLMRPTVAGDANLDGTVSIADFIDLAMNFNSTDATWDRGDVNLDGSVTIADFIDLASNFGRSYSGEIQPISLDEQRQLNAFAAANVPEAGSAIVLTIAGVLAGLRRRRATEPAAKSLSTSAANAPGDN